MNAFLPLALIAMTTLSTFAADAPKEPKDTPKDTRCYELRVYYANEGKLDALHARFRDHTTKLFEKHGITNIIYLTPVDNPDRKLYYILAYPDRKAREESWKAFLADPDWKAAAAASEKDGKLVARIESTFLHATDFSPEIEPAIEKEPRTFELRTYTATEGHLPNLLARFRDHTLKLFEKHGMTNFGYWTLDQDQKAADVTLVYLLAHKSREAAAKSFEEFRKDPDWIAAKGDSEKNANGPLTITDGVKSIFMAPTDYSPTK